jgi:Rps23 Pro-64 3,4-dihydroxylase Tpa1-like proline 4-hydroxylase
MNERLANSLLKHMNIKSVYYYNVNFNEAGRVDDKFLPQWTKFVAGKNDRPLIANNALLGDPIFAVRKQLFINFTLFDDAPTNDNIFTLIYNEDEVFDAKSVLAHMLEDLPKFVNMEKLHNKLKCVPYPFPHVVIDGFLQSDRLPKILSEVNKLQDADAQSKYIEASSPYEFNKYAFNSNYGPYLKQLFVELNSPEFIKQLEQITGVNNIICNELSLHGSGIQRIKTKGFLQLHTDFNTYHSKNRLLDRRINLCIYLNPDWKPEYKGELCLCDKNTNMCAKKIDPILNRCVIFNTTSSSIYGHPEPLNVPDDVLRQSIVVYYYTENTQGDKDIDFEGESPRGITWYPNIDISTKPKQIFYV